MAAAISVSCNVSKICRVPMSLCPNGDMSEWQCVQMAISLVTLFTVTNSLTILHPKNTLLSYNIKISHTFIAIHLYYQFTIAQPNFVKIWTFSFHIFAITVVTVVHLNGMLYNMKTFSFVQLHSCTYSQLYTCTLFTAHCTHNRFKTFFLLRTL